VKYRKIRFHPNEITDKKDFILVKYRRIKFHPDEIEDKKISQGSQDK